jgi:putative peptide maturation system protein
MRPDDVPLRDGLAFIASLVADRVPPDEALVRLRELRRRLPGLELELVWDHEPLATAPAYDLLMSAESLGTVSLALVDDGLPLPLRGMQRWRDAGLLRVDGRMMLIQDVLALLDIAWGDTRLLDRLVDVMIVRRELEREPFEASDRDLQRGVDELRRRHGLLTADATDQWLAARGLSMTSIEAIVEEQLAFAHVRGRHVGEAARTTFDAAPARWDAIDVVAFPVTTDIAARSARDRLRRGDDLLAVAAAELSATGSRALRSIVFETVPRGEIEPLGPDDELAPGHVLAARLRGAGPYVVCVRTITAASWDDATRDAVETALFDAWLATRRAAARVEWNWGPSS